MMPEINFRLSSSTQAIAETDTATNLIEQKERLETAISNQDPSLSIDLSKAFLETIFKTILSDRVENPNLEKNFQPLFNDVKGVLELSSHRDISEKLSRLSNQIVHITGELRNRYGAASHGDDGYHQTPLTMGDVQFVASTVDGLASFLYRKHRETLDPREFQRVLYADYPEFNDFIDGQYDSFSMPLSTTRIIEFTASQLLFDRDPSLYREMLIQFLESDDDME